MNASEAGYEVFGIVLEAIVPKIPAELKRIAGECEGRMLGVGADQYDMGGEQKFERMAPAEIIAGAREELLDLINYAAMTIIRLDQVRERIAGIEELEEPACSFPACSCADQAGCEGELACEWPYCKCLVNCTERADS